MKKSKPKPKKKPRQMSPLEDWLRLTNDDWTSPKAVLLANYASAVAGK